MKTTKTANHLLAVFADFVFPQSCFLCSSGNQPVCAKCAKVLPPAMNACIKCSRKNPLGRTCRGCQRKTMPELALSRFAYIGGAKRLIQLFKYEDSASLGRFFAKELSGVVKQIPDYQEFFLQPIPLHYLKLIRRGYNQSQLIAKRLGSILEIPLTDSLTRVEASSSQALSESKKEREAKIKGAFKLKNKLPANILLIDDVVTTGATMRQAAKILILGGAKRVICISAAR